LKVGDKVVDLKDITMPLLNIYASADHLVPPAATKPLNDLVGTADKTLYEFKGGHIGVFVGSKSQKELAPAISQWLHERVGEATASEQHPKVAKGAETGSIETVVREGEQYKQKIDPAAGKTAGKARQHSKK